MLGAEPDSAERPILGNSIGGGHIWFTALDDWGLGCNTANQSVTHSTQKTTASRKFKTGQQDDRFHVPDREFFQFLSPD